MLSYGCNIRSIYEVHNIIPYFKMYVKHFFNQDHICHACIIYIYVSYYDVCTHYASYDIILIITFKIVHNSPYFT